MELLKGQVAASALAGCEWRKSSYSDAWGACLEVAHGGRVDGEAIVGLRDSKNPTGPVFAVHVTVWNTFVSRCAVGDFDPRVA
jgi:Domain of unknown function (DUF397)